MIGVHPDDEVLHIAPRRHAWTIPVAVIVAVGLLIAAVVALARHASRPTAGRPKPVATSPAQPLARGALVFADRVGLSTASYIGVGPGRVTFALAVVNTSPGAVAPVYPVAVTLNGQPVAGVQLAGLYAIRGTDPLVVTATSATLASVARGQVVDLVVQLDLTCRSKMAMGTAPTVKVALRGMRGTADFDLGDFGQDWAALRQQVCQPTHG